MNSFSYKIQILRGLAIMGVVLIHNTPEGIAQVIYRPLINYSVGLFLFLSGLLTSYQTLDYKKRLKKVLIPYVIWTLVYVVATSIKTPQMIMERLLPSLAFASAAAMFYYIFVYLELNLCVEFFDRIGKSKYKLWVFLIPVIEIILFRSLPMLGVYTLEPIWGRVLSISCLPWIAYFYFGYLLVCRFHWL